MDIPLEEIAVAFDDDAKRQAVIDAVGDVVASVAEDGADIVIPGDGIISMLLNQEGITEMHGVPIMDQIAVLVRLTETYVDFYEMGAFETSEAGCMRHQTWSSSKNCSRCTTTPGESSVTDLEW
jgi:Asp/Glu/hydantoin racemase